ncbi:MAG: hypothetical protein D6711_11585 [Chloroflexi bacterium]|nr:MAG: hypothetical protein D6711_11585 [Chloroflexota bacterium]
MPINIAPGFSVYQLVERVQKFQGSALINSRRTMNIISYEIENTTIIDGARTRIFSAFQRMSRFLPQIKRYQKLAKHAESIYVFGVPDVPVPAISNVTYIYLEPHMQLAKEWFLVSYGKDYASALATEEITHIDSPNEQRQFKGIWTFDVSMVAILEEWLTRTVDARPLLVDESQHDGQSQKQFIQRIYTRINKRLDQKTLATETNEQLTAMLHQTIEPALHA